MNSIDALETSTRIRVLNDNFRSTFIGGQVVMSAGVADLPMGTRAQVVLKVQSFADFNACEFGSEDPADPEKTTRVLTIMFAGEY